MIPHQSNTYRTDLSKKCHPLAFIDRLKCPFLFEANFIFKYRQWNLDQSTRLSQIISSINAEINSPNQNVRNISDNNAEAMKIHLRSLQEILQREKQIIERTFSQWNFREYRALEDQENDRLQILIASLDAILESSDNDSSESEDESWENLDSSGEITSDLE